MFTESLRKHVNEYMKNVVALMTADEIKQANFDIYISEWDSD